MRFGLFGVGGRGYRFGFALPLSRTYRLAVYALRERGLALDLYVYRNAGTWRVGIPVDLRFHKRIRLF